MRFAVIVALGIALGMVTNSVYPELTTGRAFRERSSFEELWIYAPMAFAVAAWVVAGALARTRLLAVGYAWGVVVLSEILVVRHANDVGLPPRNDFWTNEPSYWIFAALTLVVAALIALAGNAARNLVPRHAA